MDRIDVSPEMVALVGSGHAEPAGVAMLDHGFLLGFGSVGTAASMRLIRRPSVADLNVDSGNRLVLLARSDTCEKVAGGPIRLSFDTAYYLSAPLRSIALAIRDCTLHEAAARPYRLAKSIELLCEILRVANEIGFIPIGQDAVLSQADSERLLRARAMIEERWAEKLTLDMIARACGLNRAKLTRGYRDMFDCSVADAIAQERLGKAGEMLLATELPVSSIGYRCGYLNNTSFTRAFVRRFGVAPTQYRTHRLAA
ncbi:AraC family transcriptional regulator [Sphingobium sp.]|uniref:AraC family transcriptional regulator n=1 Tax=Sphingobium sp. TaxID=1912891 RepID=UPI002C1C9650|nr:AraC family transcriptional regulator [Sphingobium sp.]HUD93545.1 AraC family transcriptional regulator [Sphingobium sp.]